MLGPELPHREGGTLASGMYSGAEQKAEPQERHIDEEIEEFLEEGDVKGDHSDMKEKNAWDTQPWTIFFMMTGLPGGLLILAFAMTVNSFVSMAGGIVIYMFYVFFIYMGVFPRGK